MKLFSKEVINNDSSVDAIFIKKMEYLLTVIQDLSKVHTLERIQSIVKKAARELTGCDGASFILMDGDQCFYADEEAISPLWKGQRFPLKACISGWVIQNRQSVIIEDIYTDDRIPYAIYRPTFVRSLSMVPIRSLDPIGAIGNYWADIHKTTDKELALLQALADATSVAMENAQLYSDLSKLVKNTTRT